MKVVIGNLFNNYNVHDAISDKQLSYTPTTETSYLRDKDIRKVLFHNAAKLGVAYYLFIFFFKSSVK